VVFATDQSDRVGAASSSVAALVWCRPPTIPTTCLPY